MSPTVILRESPCCDRTSSNATEPSFPCGWLLVVVVGDSLKGIVMVSNGYSPCGRYGFCFMDAPRDTIVAWVAGLKAGKSSCAYRLYGDIYEQLVRLSKQRFSGLKPRWADEEDVALSVFQSFCERAAAGQFPQLDNRDDLWKILVTLTCRKVRDYVRFDRRQKRGGGAVRGESVFMDADEPNAPGINAAEGNELPPDMALLVAEESRRLLDCLEDETLAQIAVWKMEGFTDQEIATRLDCAVRTVERKVARIREKWSREASSDSPASLDS